MAEVYQLASPDVEEFVVAWLYGLGDESGTERPLGDELPYRMVTAVAATEDPFMGQAKYFVDVDTFAQTRAGAQAAAQVTQDRMNLLAVEQSSVAVDGGVVNAEYVKTLQRPIWVDYRSTFLSR